MASMAAMTAALASATIAQRAEAANAVWTGASSTDWFAAGNWSPAILPTNAVEVDINGNAATPTIINKAGAVAGSVWLGVAPGQSGALTIDGGALADSGFMIVGNDGSGVLIVRNAGKLTSGIGAIGNDPGSAGVVTITGTGSVWTATGFIDVGSSGAGTLNILAGGAVNTSSINVGNDTTATGHVLVDGSGSTITLSSTSIAAVVGSNGDMTISNGGKLAGGVITAGAGGQASLVVNTGGLVTGSQINIGGAGAGSATFDGAGTTMTMTGTVNVGQASSGTLTASSGATMSSQFGVIGVNSGVSGAATVTGAGSKWTMGNSLTVGQAGKGQLTVSSGGVVGADSLKTTSTSQIQVTGSGSQLNIAKTLTLAAGAGASTIDISNGGTLTGTTATVSASAGASMAVTLSGATSTWNPTALTVGGPGTADVTVNAGASMIDVGDLTIDGAGAATFKLSGASLTQGLGPVGNNAGTGTFIVGSTAKGAFTVDNGGTLSTRFSELGDGAGSNGTMTITGAGSSWLIRSGGVTGYSGTGTLNILNGASVAATGQSGSMVLGFNAGGSGTMLIDGAGSKFSSDAALTVGNSGTGALTASGGATLTVGSIFYVGENFIFFGATPGSGVATLTGAGTTLSANAVEVGAAGGAGTLNVLNGAVVSAKNPSAIADGLISSGVELNGAGSMTVDGPGSKFVEASTLDVGARGPGQMTISNGGFASNTDGYIGSYKNQSGSVGVGVATVTGAGSTWTSTGTLRAGDQGDGTLKVLAGGTVSDKTGIVGASKGGVGRAVVDGAGSAWTSSANLTVGGSGSGVLTVANGGVVSAGGAAGSGTVTIASAATATGVLNIGADKAGAAAAAGTINAAGVAFGAGAGTLVFNHTSSSLDFAPVISGAGQVIQQGGVTILSKAETYSGATQVNGGTLLVNGALASSAVSVAAGATLGGSGSLAGAVNVADGGNLKAAAGAVLNLGSLALGDDSNLNLALGAPSDTAVIAVTGALTLDGRLNVSDAGGFALGTYRLMNYGGALTNNGLVIASLPSGFNPGNWAIDAATGGQVNLLVQAGPNVQYWDGANMTPGSVAEGRGGSGVWNLANTNWTNQAGTINAPWASGSAVFAGAGGTVSVESAIDVSGLSFKADGYVLTAGGAAGSLRVTGGPTPVDVATGATAVIGVAMGGAGGLLKTGLGTLVLSGANSYTGGTAVTEGVLQVAADANLGAAAGGLTLDAGTLRYGAGFASARGVTLGGGGGTIETNGQNASLTEVVGGAGRLTKTGAGVLALSGSNTYAAGTAVTGGVLQVGADANLGAAAGSLSLDSGVLRYAAGFASGRAVTLGAGGGTIDTNGADASLTGVVAGTGRLTKTGSGTLTLGGANSYEGGTLITGGVLAVGADGALGDQAGGLGLDGGVLRYTAGFATDRGVTLGAGGGTFDTNTFEATLGGVVGGPGALGKVGAGTLILTGANTYLGGTRVTGGAVQASADANLGDGAGVLALDGGAFRFGAGFSMARSVSLGAGGGTVDTNGQSGAMLGPVGGAGRLFKTGAGVLTLGGANGYAGGTLVTAGTLQVSADANLGSAAGGLVLDGGTLLYAAGFSSARTVSLDAGGGTVDTSTFSATLSGVVGGAGLLNKTGAGTLILTGANTWTGGAKVLAGTLRGSAASLRGDIADAGAVVFDQGVDGTYAGVLSGAGSFAKQGAGTLTLTGASGAFTGASTVSAGTLRVDGAVGGPISVAAGARLQGVGSVGPAVVAGTIAPGNSIGVLTANGNYVQQAGSAFEAEISPNGSGDRLSVTGAATLQGGTVNAITLPGTYAPGTHYTILSAAGGVSGQFAGLNQSLTFAALTLNYTANSVYLNVVRNVVPFASIGVSDTQKSVGAAVDALGGVSPVYGAIVFLDDAGARAAFDALSGEVHADVQGQFLEDSRFVREAVSGRLDGAGGERQAVWAEGFGAWGHRDGEGGPARVSRHIRGAFFGGDRDLGGGWRIGASVGLSRADMRVPGRDSTASYDDTTLAAYVGRNAGPLQIKGGVAYAWQRVTTVRSVGFGAFADSDVGRYRADTRQVFGEAAWRLKAARFDITPFASAAYVEVHTDAFGEFGGAAALSGADQGVRVTHLGLGARAGVDLGDAVRLDGSVSLRHVGGERAAADRLQFRAGGPGFDVTGATLVGDAAAVQTTVTVRLGGYGSAFLGYSGVIGDIASDHGVRGGLRVRF